MALTKIENGIEVLLSTEEENIILAEWEANAPKLVDILSSMTAKIKDERNRRWYDGGVKVGTDWFYSTSIAMGEYNSMLFLSSGQIDSYVIRAGWRPMSGGSIDMTVGLLKQIMTNGFIQLGLIDDAAQTHIAELNLSATPETYNYLTNWPLIYGE